jgi:predicted GNAT family acetyltransferase
MWNLVERMGEGIRRVLRAVAHPKGETLRNVTTGRIEIERNGELAYLEYSLADDVLELIHTEVPKALRGMQLASSLAETALNWAREKHYKVDIICPFVRAYIAKHPEYSDLVVH